MLTSGISVRSGLGFMFHLPRRYYATYYIIYSRIETRTREDSMHA